MVYKVVAYNHMGDSGPAEVAVPRFVLLDEFAVEDLDPHGGGIATTITGSGTKTLYVRESDVGTAAVELSATLVALSPDLSRVLWRAVPKGTTSDIASGTFGPESVSLTLTKESGPDIDFEATIDKNANGLWDGNENVLRTVQVHVVPFVELVSLPRVPENLALGLPIVLTRSGRIDQSLTARRMLQRVIVRQRSAAGRQRAVDHAVPVVLRRLPGHATVAYIHHHGPDRLGAVVKTNGVLVHGDM